mmetsp:Transcript_42/g.74  ORF Transcript_42/g.74 Transcript_42/m.74 type:complete len:133 (-) Transcript_42:15-413(-)
MAVNCTGTDQFSAVWNDWCWEFEEDLPATNKLMFSDWVQQAPCGGTAISVACSLKSCKFDWSAAKTCCYSRALRLCTGNEIMMPDENARECWGEDPKGVSVMCDQRKCDPVGDRPRCELSACSHNSSAAIMV